MITNPTGIGGACFLLMICHAKKTVASLHEGSKEGRAYTKVIKMVKSPKTGAYVFDEQMVANEKVQDFFKK